VSFADTVPDREPFDTVLFAEPTFFDVTYVINSHMVGNVGSVDRDLAWKQWQGVVEAYRQIGYRIETLPGVEGLPDLCFIANQSLPFVREDGSKAVILSNMANPQRRAEVPIVEAWFRERGWEILRIPDEEVHFEGTGDALWHPRKRHLHGGHGFRTHHTAYIRRTGFVTASVTPLELRDLRFYHLDTCLAPLDAETALYVHEAFTEQGLASLREAFPRLLRCPIDEAEDVLACNGHCPDTEHFIVDAAATKTMALVRDAGFTPIGVDTSEFRKSGGSVQCLKLMVMS
jgi:N-dimethylarginine dimethylaminohydrolase